MTTPKEWKDQRRADLIIPYVAPEPKNEETDIAGTLGTALPMAAMFTRNRLIGWTAVLFAIQSWLNEVPSQVAAGKQPAFFSVGMSIMSLVIAYLPIFFPQMGSRGPGAGTGTEAPPPVEPAVGA